MLGKANVVRIAHPQFDRFGKHESGYAHLHTIEVVKDQEASGAISSARWGGPARMRATFTSG